MHSNYDFLIFNEFIAAACCEVCPLKLRYVLWISVRKKLEGKKNMSLIKPLTYGSFWVLKTYFLDVPLTA